MQNVDIGLTQGLTAEWTHLIGTVREARGRLLWDSAKARSDVAGRIDDIEKEFTRLVEHVHKMVSSFQKYIAAEESKHSAERKK